MSNIHHDLLTSILTPERLAAIHALYFTWADDSGLPNATSLLNLLSNDVAAELKPLCFTTALSPLSKLPFAELPPLLPYLPDPATPEFPIQALGLHLLLDQAPRQLYSGNDAGLTFGHFGELTLRFARELAALPESVQPQRVQRWQELGYSFEGAWLRAFLLWTAFIHSEDLDAQRFGQRMIEEECRKAAEVYYGVTDPTRECDEADDRDLVLFPKMFKEAEGESKGLSSEDGVWMFCRIVRAHEPIVRAFGRYPTRNMAMGRENTEDEAKYLKEIRMYI